MTKISGIPAAIIIAVMVASCTNEQIEPTVDCTGSLLQAEAEQVTDVNCGEENGSFVIRASGGNEPYRFTLDGVQNSTGTFTGFAAGNYVVEVADSVGCSTTVAVTIKNQTGVNLDQLITQDASCGGSEGSIEVQASDGVEPYMYSLNGGAFQASNTFSGLGIGTYAVAVKDASDCETSQSVSLLSGVSYESSIKSIIATNCAISGCHNGTVAPDFRLFNTIQSRAGRIKARTGNRSMPQGRTLTQTEIDLIACWVDDGALDN